MSRSVRVKHLWVDINPELELESFIDELVELCKKYAYSTIHHPHFSFTFTED